MYRSLTLADIGKSLISKYILKFCLHKIKNITPGLVWCESERTLNSAVQGVCFISLGAIIISLPFVNILNVFQKLFLKKNISTLSSSFMVSRKKLMWRYNLCSKIHQISQCLSSSSNYLNKYTDLCFLLSICFYCCSLKIHWNKFKYTLKC